MSFQEAKRESIKRYMLEKIRMDDEEFIEKTMDNFGISITTVKRYVKEELEKQTLCADEERQCGYRLYTQIFTFEYAIEGLDEDTIYLEDVAPLLDDVSKQAKHIWYYAFAEMMNNAIEHSEGNKIQCTVYKDCLYTEIRIVDDGVGIFRNVQQYLKNTCGKDFAYQDVIAELYKGKLTTKRENHSGEGIFFTSKVLYEFAIWSEGAALKQGYYEQGQLIESHLLAYYNKLNQIGTMVVMRLENDTTRTIKEVFDMYAPIEKGFVKTRIPLAEVCLYAQPVARSQARRLLHRLEEFEQVEFDFAGVEYMAQGFADEVFRVFHNQHPEVELIPLNANESVLGMIQHVRR
ncbi:MAG: DUF4325 domain-containing protein [Faecalimonas sp.]|nr:DUF4325 domain-containing protein [Faecalimonas sp.]